jgi:hypothetical protein
MRQTRTEKLKEVYASIQNIDRIDFDEDVDIDRGDDSSATPSFDVIFRNKYGDPRLAAVFDNTPDPITENKVHQLINDAGWVSQSEAPFNGAFFVTTSYFEAKALEAAYDATCDTRGRTILPSVLKNCGPFSNLYGYHPCHACLVNAKENDFSLVFPEL